MCNEQTRWEKVWPDWMPRQIEVHKSFTEYFRDQAAKSPATVAIDFYGLQINYQDLNCQIDQFANALIQRGLQKGDRVGIYMQNCPQFVISFFAIVRAGGTVLSLNPMFRSMELTQVLQKTTPSVVIVQNDLYPEMSKALATCPASLVIQTHLADYIPAIPTLPPPIEISEQIETDPGCINFMDLLNEGEPTPVCRIDDLDKDLALLQLTGGTTGKTKAAMISTRALTVAVTGSVYWSRLTSEDIFLGVSPFFHIMGLQVIMIPTLISGGKLVILSRFSPEVTARAISEKKCTVWVAAPTMITALLNMPEVNSYDFSSLRIAVTGGSPIPLSLQERFSEIAPKCDLGEGYGTTEILSQGGATTPLGRWKAGFIGIPTINEIKIININNRQKEMPANQVGMIVIKGPALMNGYWNDPEETAMSFLNGWFCTGDLGLMDEEGYLKVVGRKKELIICSGFNVYPGDVENILSRHPAVLEVAVISVPDTYRGESPKAVVVLKKQFEGKVSEDNIICWCKKNMASYKRPHIVEFREALPKSAAGKVLKRKLN